MTLNLLRDLMLAEPEPEELPRYRLFPTLGTRVQAWYRFGEEEAVKSAREYFAVHEIPVAVCLAPAGGLVKMLYVVGKEVKKTTRRTK